jgi:hypothetical protein
MKKIGMLFLFLFLLQLMGCLSKPVDCKMQYEIYFINRSQDSLNVKLVNKQKLTEYKMAVRDSLIALNGAQVAVDTIDYKWTGDQDCVLYLPTYKLDLYLVAEVRKHDSLISQYNLYPWDTTAGSKFICTDCTDHFKDTLFVP